MAINILGEDIYIQCTCGSREFIEKEIIALEKASLSTGIIVKKTFVRTSFLCAKCERNCNDLVKKYEVI